MFSMLRKLKKKWGIRSNLHLILILAVFSVNGTLTLFIKKPLFELLGVDPSDPFWLRTAVYILTVTPVYFSTLPVVALLFGQFRFFWEFEKKTLGRIFGKHKKTGNTRIPGKND